MDISVGFNNDDFIRDLISVLIKNNGYKAMFVFRNNPNGINVGLYTRLIIYKSKKMIKEMDSFFVSGECYKMMMY